MSAKSRIPEHLSFFWDVYQIKEVPHLLEADNVSSLEAVIGKISQLIHTAGFDRNILRSLPVEFLLLLDVEPCVSCDQKIINAALPHFLRDVSHQNIPQEHKIEEQLYSPMQRFIHDLEEELEKIATGDIDLGSMKDLSEVKLSDHLPLQDACRLGARLASASDVVQRSVEIGTAFCLLLENFFYMLTEDAKGAVTKLFYEKHLSETGSLPSLEKYLQDVSLSIVQVINQIGDHVSIQNDAMKFNQVRDKLSWYLLAVPRMAINRMLMQSLENKLIVPGVMNILRSCPALSDVLIKSEKITSERVPILVDSVISVLENEIHRWAIPEEQDRLVYLLTSLCRRKRVVKEKAEVTSAAHQATAAVPEVSVVNGGILLRLIVIPNLMKRAHEIVMLKSILRVVQNVGAKEIHVEWTKNIGENRSNAVRAPELVLLVVELFMEYESKRQQASEICRSILKSLGEKLKDDDIVFGKDTVDFILFSLRRYQWWIRYAICSWFSHTLSSPAQQLPAGLFKSLPLDQQERCEQISVDFSFSPAECFCRSFFELALFDVDLAAGFLQRGVSVRPQDENIVEKIALALLESYEQTFSRQPVTSLAQLLLELLRALDPSQGISFSESLCESTFHGLRLIQHLLLLATAVKVAYYKSSDKALNNCPRSKDPVTDTAQVAGDLLQGFCELAKAHAEKEVVNLRRSRLPFPPEIKEDHLPPPQVTIRRDECVYAQLSTLFNVSCSFTRLVVQPPMALQVLINRLAELLFEVQGMRVGIFLDNIPSEHLKSNTVYAFAQSAHAKKQADSPRQTNRASRAHARPLDTVGVTRSDDGSCCVENELFDQSTLRTKGSNVEALATAKQINGMNLRRNAEKRLTNRESEANVVNPTAIPSSQTNGDNSSRNGKKKRGAKHR
ncbi:hypothetical protein ANCCAN_17321 [Ancylostoma caninum]|uniref:Edg1 TPR repeats region domain-containing protein n=1 Tax=Ancylostoma caninum TaxID=29170 RepID=A0A368G0J7_ANCCA|nr:hypothetical protein ANCCAN_17321 [Ancylostoma caninum]